METTPGHEASPVPRDVSDVTGHPTMLLFRVVPAGEGGRGAPGGV